LSSEQYRRLIEQLRVWCNQDRGRQQMLATRLGASRQTISAWLNESRMMSLDQYFEVLSAIEESGDPQFKEDPMSIRTPSARTRPPTNDEDEEPLDHLNAGL
jgi:transcriptional regulator with XRE-family HTH domain